MYGNNKTEANLSIVQMRISFMSVSTFETKTKSHF